MDGSNGGWPVLYGASHLGGGRLSVAYDEDQLQDSERSHTTEQVAYVIFDDYMPTPGPKLHHGVETDVTDTWRAVVLPESYDDLIVVATPEYHPSGDPLVTRVRNVASDRFELRVQNPSGQVAPTTTVHWVAVEAGVFTEAEHGIRMEAVKFDSSVTDDRGSWSGSAQMYRQAENWIQAGRCYEEARDFEQAADSYREARAIDLWLSALERSGAIFDAAKIALENDRRPRAMRLLQCIAPEDEDYAEASWLLTLAFEREGHFDLAAQQLEQHISTFHPSPAPTEKYSRLADLFEQAGSLERALEVLEDLRRREPTYPDVATRIEFIRKQRSVSDRSRVNLGEAMLPADAPTAFVSESRYEILDEIGRGGMGVVYRAHDRRLDRVVALKRLPDDLRRHQPRAAQLFVREAQAAARLNHPHIVTVHDADQEEGHLFITMELLDGNPFNTILKEKGPLGPGHLMAVAWQVASALQYAHEQGVVHRDIKTANLFLTTENTVKVMDFGLAKMFEEVRGGTTVITGTPFYMSPEQVMGERVDHRTDLYSLGVTLFELATGKVPFAEGDVAYHHRHTSPPDPRSLASGLSAEMASLLLDLLEKDPDHRCASAEELLRRLAVLREAGLSPAD